MLEELAELGLMEYDAHGGFFCGWGLAVFGGLGRMLTVSDLLLVPGSSIDFFAVINIGKGEQFTSGFVGANPNSKIPAAVDFGTGGAPIRLFESASIVLYLAEKYGRFLPTDLHKRTEVMNFVFWQMAGQGLVLRGRRESVVGIVRLT